MSIGKRIYRNFDRIEKSLLDKFSNAASANVSDCMERLYSMDASIRPIGKQKKILGQAITIKSALADNMLFHKALMMAHPGDVIVVNAGGDMNYSVCGDIMYTYAQSKGIAGFVVDGCIRDLDYLQKNNFPVYAAGITGRGPYKNGPGEINVDISCGGQVVHAGDIILGDEDGIVVIPPKDAEFILGKVDQLKKNEILLKELITDGKWEEGNLALQVNELLEQKGYEII